MVRELHGPFLRFTTPQLGEYKEHKTAIAYQVRRHAARVAAFRQRKEQESPCAISNAKPPQVNESCFHVNLDSKPGVFADSGRGDSDVQEPARRGSHRPRWTAVYKLSGPKKSGDSRSDRELVPSSTTSPAASIPDCVTSPDQITDVDTWDLPWPTTDDLVEQGEQQHSERVRLLNELQPAQSKPFCLVFDTGEHIPDERACQLMSKLGSGFRHLNFLPWQLAKTLEKAVVATVALDQIARGVRGAPQLVNVVEEARAFHSTIQDVAISTTNANTIDGMLVDACCIASLIYCELVLYPSPSEDQILRGLLEKLRSLLEVIEFWTSEEPALASVTDMLLWTTVLGAIAALTYKEDAWTISRLANLIRGDDTLQSWNAFASKMSRFLWWQPVCDQLCWRVWQKALALTVESTTAVVGLGCGIG